MRSKVKIVMVNIMLKPRVVNLEKNNVACANCIKRNAGRVILTFLCVLIFIIFLFAVNKFRTLKSVRKVNEYPLYIMNYYGDYGFDKYLKKGSRSFEELNEFLKKELWTGKALNEKKIEYGCSCFSAPVNTGGRVYGRNLDLPGYHPAVVVYTDPPEGYASISIVELTVLGYGSSANKFIMPGLVKRTGLLAAPYVPRDGMNEYGLAVSTLNVPHAEPGNDVSKITIGRWQVVRLLLDHTRNVDEAVELLEKYNVDMGGSGAHYFIADSSGKSVVIEYLEGKMKVVPNSGSWQAVTNFILSTREQEGSGRDRYEKIKDFLIKRPDGISSEEGMDLLKRVSQPTTVWSAEYNLTRGELEVAIGKEYDESVSFKLKMKK